MSLVLPLDTRNSISLIRKQVKRNYLNIASLLATKKKKKKAHFLGRNPSFLLYILQVSDTNVLSLSFLAKR